MNPLILQQSQPGDAGHTALSVNVNRVALLRNSRPVGLPDVVRLAAQALQAGADGITVHPRPDARHITSVDVHELCALLRRWPQAEFNLEGNPFHNLMDLVRAVRPQQATFVPDSAEQATSDHGWNLQQDGERLRPLVAELQALGVRVSLFMDPDPAAMALARAVGADRVELYTEAYAHAHARAHPRDREAGMPVPPADGGPGLPRAAVPPDAQAQLQHVLQRYADAARAALAAGLGLNAGHDLNRDNLALFLQQVPGVAEVSIGHAIAADALELGMAETVRAYQRIIRGVFAAPGGPAAGAGR
jgi:pyridoxine 5-phosphate synthase